MTYSLRPFRSEDAARLAEIFAEAVRVVGAHGYSPTQVAAWLARAPARSDALRARIEDDDWIVVAVDPSDAPVAYALLEPDGHLDHLYCHPDHTRRGLAERLLKAAETQARNWNCARLYTEASELARPALERAGYSLVRRRDFTIEHGGKQVPIHNYAMEKPLD